MRKSASAIKLQKSSSPIGLSLLFCCIFIIMLPSIALSQTTDTLWIETWEGNWLVDWHVSAGTWDVGMPTSGPDTTHEGLNCAATVLEGNYWDYIDSTRLVRHLAFEVPQDHPRLRFWHWYSFQINDDDYGKVQIRVDGNPNWEDLDVYRDHSGGIWTNPYIDLSAWAGLKVEIAFYLHSDDYYNQSGWYIDEVAVISGDINASFTQDWETGFDGWYVDYGTWQVGTPNSGPNGTHEGLSCVATILDGSYWDYIDSTRLISPPFEVSMNNPRLRFWHWYSFQINDDDYGKVQIRVDGNPNWIDLDEYRDHGGGIWTKPYLDLSAYAGLTIQVAFYLHSDDYYNQSGWYIDEVEIETGWRVFTSPEDWESGFDDWYVDYGTWEVGTPTHPNGPAGCYEGQSCVGTVLSGNYWDYIDNTRLISPPFIVPSNESVLRFWHWYYFQVNDDDYGKVQIRVVGNQDWTDLAEYRDTGGGEWTSPFLPLSDFADSTVELAFLFHSDDYYNQSGWFIDSVTVEGIEGIGDNPPSSTIPLSFTLSQNHPNPFNPSTTIEFDIPGESHGSQPVNLAVYDLRGRLVKTLADSEFEPGKYRVHWDGRNDSGEKVSSGIYLYRLKTGDKRFTRKMTLSK